MKKYIEHIYEIAKGNPLYTTPIPIDVLTMRNLFDAFSDELTYIEYRFLLNSKLDVRNEIAILKNLYVFNYVVRHVYNWMNMDMCVDLTMRRCLGKKHLTLQDVVFHQCSIMGDYAFYDGRPCNEVYR